MGPTWDLVEGLKVFLDDADDTVTDVSGTQYASTDTPRSTDAPTRASADAPRPSTTSRQRLEVEHLHAELASLRAQIHALQLNPTREMSFWERVAKLERLDLLRAKDENDRLRQSLDMHKTFMTELEAHVQKKRRLANSTDPCFDESLAFWLPESGDDGGGRRVRAMHAIVDREYRRMHSVFLRHGLLGHTNNVFRTQLVPQPSGEIYFTVVEHAVLAAPFRAIGAAVWRLIASNGTRHSVDGLAVSTDSVDETMVYEHVINTRHATPCHTNLVHKYYTSSTSDVIVSRSVLVDPMWPTANALVEDCASWVEVETMPGQSSCLFTFVLRINLGQDSPTEARDHVVASLERVSLAQEPPVEGTLAHVAASVHFGAPSVAPSNLHIVLERGMHLEGPFKRAVNAAIDAYRESVEHIDDRQVECRDQERRD
ncbi:Aste57867_16242 [Aphanomyces stellatus]|uniref:Aste57867_16242 protein n=1 Tax=Aphanomyces stellatus TaxID=120398 RepID=A0A485L892_9STRA|nr:hypothetical protein As57867_016185 [Aphanomyces stellatus]VFT93020.1 Aste57867_16242 [Aphanomyces stellatus]